MVDVLSTYFSERVLLIGADGTIIDSLGRPRGMLGFSADERAGMHVAERVHPGDLPAVLDLLARARQSQVLEEVTTVRARHKDGSWRRLEVAVFSRVDDAIVGAAVLRLRDVRDQPARLDGTEERFVSLAEALPIGVLSADVTDFLVFTNEAARSLLGAGFARLRGRGWLDQIHPNYHSAIADAITEARATGRRTGTTVATVDRAGSLWLQLLVVPLTSGDRYVGWVATLEDVTARLTAEREVAHRATHDALTGLPNRWLLMDRLQQALSRCARGRRGVTVVFIDIDGLKAHNDSYGHSAGDAILVDAARRIDRELRTGETAARFGGDEFVVVSDVNSECEDDELAQRLRNTLDYQLNHAATSLTVTACVGVAFTDDPNVTPDQVLAAADAVMYQHKPRDPC